MKFSWAIEDADKEAYRGFIGRYIDHPFVRQRIERNVEHRPKSVSREEFWRVLLGCFLTTQQRSGEGSRVERFVTRRSELLDVEHCLASKNIVGEALRILSENRLRRSETISMEIAHAISKLKTLGWQRIESELESILCDTNVERERKVAAFLREHFKGLGPKQSRNLIQWMGLSQYELPIDSRMIKVLNQLGFPLELNASSLSGDDYYCFVENPLQELLKEIDVLPCVFDACAFASFEKSADMRK